MKRKTKKIIKNTLLGVLCLGIVGGAAAGGKALYDYSQEDLKTINPVFHVGGLDENGEYVDTDQSLYSNEFKCQGLEIKLDFENDIKFQVFYYESDGDFVKSTDVMEDDYINEESNVDITHARIVITPKWTNVEVPEDKEEEDVKVVKWTNITSFANQMTIKVDKEQVEYKNLLSNYEVVKDTALLSSSTEVKEGMDYILMEDVNDYDKLLFRFKELPSEKYGSGYYTFYADIEFDTGSTMRNMYHNEKFNVTSTNHVLVVEDLVNETSYENIVVKNLYISFDSGNLLGIYAI